MMWRQKSWIMVDHFYARGVKRAAHRFGNIRGPQLCNRNLGGGANVSHNPLENFVPVEGMLEDIIDSISQ